MILVRFGGWKQEGTRRRRYDELPIAGVREYPHMELRFEGRVLAPLAEYVKSTDLKEGEIYFRVVYADLDLLIPHLEPVVFVGRNLGAGETGQVFFQDIDSYGDGVRIEDHDIGENGDDLRGLLYKFAEDAPAVFSFECAIDDLLRCYLRRRA
jgi:hypothetical protein